MEIRLLRADEIDLRMQTVKDNGFSLLLYKDARVDMTIMDEVFGVYGWQRKHEVINDNLFCTISIYDKNSGTWIEKQDVGVESYTQKEKGQASDAFKRACFNIGIGRELYTSPFIWIPTSKKASGRERFTVSSIGYNENREINQLIIVDSKGNQVYKLGSHTKPVDAPGQAAKDKPTVMDGKGNELTCSDCGVDILPAVLVYSKRHYGKKLCMDCQSKSNKIGE